MSRTRFLKVTRLPKEKKQVPSIIFGPRSGTMRRVAREERRGEEGRDDLQMSRRAAMCTKRGPAR